MCIYIYMSMYMYMYLMTLELYVYKWYLLCGLEVYKQDPVWAVWIPGSRSYPCRSTPLGFWSPFNEPFWGIWGHSGLYEGTPLMGYDLSAAPRDLNEFPTQSNPKGSEYPNIGYL